MPHLTNIEIIQNITIHDVLRKQFSLINVRNDQIEKTSYSQRVCFIKKNTNDSLNNTLKFIK